MKNDITPSSRAIRTNASPIPRYAPASAALAAAAAAALAAAAAVPAAAAAGAGARCRSACVASRVRTTHSGLVSTSVTQPAVPAASTCTVGDESGSAHAAAHRSFAAS